MKPRKEVEKQLDNKATNLVKNGVFMQVCGKQKLSSF